MGLSSTSIIHLTDSLENVFAILKKGFKPKYCYENISSNLAGTTLHAAFPMISFSDIPLSELKSHLESYGLYGIGLTKEWAIEQKLNPVLYFDQDSNLINDIVAHFDNFIKNEGQPDFNKDYFDWYMNLLSYCKNYQGTLETKTVKKENYRFSDEREWRFIPSHEELKRYKATPFVPAANYLKDKEKYNTKLQPIRLYLKAKDIKYIIIKNDKELNKTIKYIKEYVKTLYPKLQDKLISRIITSEQILYDM